jgi:hypothetical protein
MLRGKSLSEIVVELLNRNGLLFSLYCNSILLLFSLHDPSTIARVLPVTRNGGAGFRECLVFVNATGFYRMLIWNL